MKRRISWILGFGCLALLLIAGSSRWLLWRYRYVSNAELFAKQNREVEKRRRAEDERDKRMVAKMHFPQGAVPDSELSGYGSVLSAMNEPPLVLDPSTPDYFVFRILRLPTWGPPIGLRIEKRRQTIGQRVVVMSGSGGYGIGKIKEERRSELTLNEFDLLLENIRKTGFWELNPTDDVSGFDGSSLFIEAIHDGRHLVFARWTPESGSNERGLSLLVSLCDRLFEANGFRSPN